MSRRANQDRFFRDAGGALEPDAPSYVQRPADEELLRSVLSGEYCNVLTARQMGKSSLMVRTAARLEEEGAHTALIDLAELGTFITSDQWYLGLLRLVRQDLALDVDETRWWIGQQESSVVYRFTRFVRDAVLAKTAGEIVIFIDEIDSTLSLPFTDDFFAAIRSLFNERASNPDYRRLTFVLVGVARPADLIKDRTRTPYNIGRSIDLDDFAPENARALLPGLERVYSREQSEAILDRVLYWTGGQPYLTQRVCAEVVASGNKASVDQKIDQLVEHLFFQEGQIRREVHLQWVDDYIRKNDYYDGMLSVYQEILSGRRVQDEERSIAKSHLKLSGVVKPTSGDCLQVRNRIYERVYGPKWAKMPEKRGLFSSFRKRIGRVFG